MGENKKKLDIKAGLIPKKKRSVLLTLGLLGLLAAVGLTLFLLSTGEVQAGWKLEVPIPTLKGRDVSLSNYVRAIYNFAGMIIGVIGVLMFIVGGFQYMVSAGNKGMAGEARKTMINAIVGIILVLAAYVMLSTINVELIRFEDLKFQ